MNAIVSPLRSPLLSWLDKSQINTVLLLTYLFEQSYISIFFI